MDRINASFILMEPNAIGLNFFIGCSLSDSISSKSLITYINDELVPYLNAS